MTRGTQRSLPVVVLDPQLISFDAAGSSLFRFSISGFCFLSGGLINFTVTGLAVTASISLDSYPGKLNDNASASLSFALSMK